MSFSEREALEFFVEVGSTNSDIRAREVAAYSLLTLGDSDPALALLLEISRSVGNDFEWHARAIERSAHILQVAQDSGAQRAIAELDERIAATKKTEKLDGLPAL